MTPRNPLDEKVILDVRDLYFASACVRDAIRQADQALAGSDYLRGLSVRLDQALAQDLTGWAAVPVVQTQEMLDAGKNEYQMVLATFGSQYKFDAIGEAYRAMLEASPPLTGDVA